MKSYRLYVPAEGVKHDVRKGSAIVGDSGEHHIMTHYEGGGADNVKTFEQKIHHAAGRREQRYPTIAIRAWRHEELNDVGSVRYDEIMRHWVIDEITQMETLRQWVGPDETLVSGGSDPLIIEQGGFLFAKMPAVEQAMLLATATPLVDKCREAIAFHARRSA